MKAATFYCGTSNIVLPVIKTQFPPEFQDKSRLTYYSSLFNSLEVNSSFYKNPMPATVVRWAESVPDHFRFTYKLSKEITHAKGLNFDPSLIKRFMAVIDGAGSKKGCLLMQFPGSIQFERLNEVYQLLDHIMEADPDQSWRLAVEFRNPSWYCEETYEMLRDYAATLVIHDMPKSNPPPFQETAKCVYLRFHGIAGDYRGGYTDEALAGHATKIKEWKRLGYDVFCYFNNTLGEAYKNAVLLDKFSETL